MDPYVRVIEKVIVTTECLKTPGMSFDEGALLGSEREKTRASLLWEISTTWGCGGNEELEGMKNPLTQECEACSPIHLPLDELYLRDRPFHHSVVDPPS